MWWAAVPSAAIMCVALAIPDMFMYVTNMYFRQTREIRQLTTADDVAHYWRDCRLGQRRHPYNQIGLDNLQDYCEPPVIKEEECTCPPKAS